MGTKLVACFGSRAWTQFIGLTALISLMLASAGLKAAEITVFAAASLTDALKELRTDYARQSSDKVVFNLGASSLLARQIEAGAPADVFFSADELKMDALEEKGLLLPGSRKSLLSNSLVIVIAADSNLKINSAADLAQPTVKRIALADPKAVPAGVYSRQYLEGQKLWTAVADKVVPTENVRAALAAVESGNVEAGIVFKTDATISKKVKVACEIKRADGPPISYPAAVIQDSKQIAAAKHFLQYLGSDEATRIFEHYGFVVLSKRSQE